MICSQCQASTKTLWGKTYCRSCGWNLARVERELLDNVKGGVVFGPFLALFVVFFGEIGFLGRWPLEVIAVVAALLLGSASVFVLVNAKAVVEVRRDWRRVSVETAPQVQVPQEYVYLLLVRPPRPLRMTAEKRKEVGFYLLWLVWFYFMMILIPSEKMGPIDKVWAIPFMTVLVPSYLIVRELPTRRLLRGGELTFGRVILLSRHVSRWKTSASEVTYEFQCSGRRIVQSVHDGSGSLREGAVVPIFYDPQRPSRNVTPLAAGYVVPQPED